MTLETRSQGNGGTFLMLRGGMKMSFQFNPAVAAALIQSAAMLLAAI